MKYPRKVHAWEIVVRPSLWYRNEQTSEDFDRWLSDAMDAGMPATLKPLELGGSVAEVEVEGMEIWIMNAPYADAATRSAGRGWHFASRKTALRLRRAIEPLLKAHYRFQAPTQGRQR